MDLLIVLLIKLLDVYLWIIILTVVISWLTVFGVLNLRNKWVYKVCEGLNKLTDPPIKALRRVIPPIGGIDLTPMIIIFAIYILQSMLVSLL